MRLPARRPHPQGDERVVEPPRLRPPPRVQRAVAAHPDLGDARRQVGPEREAQAIGSPRLDGHRIAVDRDPVVAADGRVLVALGHRRLGPGRRVRVLGHLLLPTLPLVLVDVGVHHEHVAVALRVDGIEAPERGHPVHAIPADRARGVGERLLEASVHHQLERPRGRRLALGRHGPLERDDARRDVGVGARRQQAAIGRGEPVARPAQERGRGERKRPPGPDRRAEAVLGHGDREQRVAAVEQHEPRGLGRGPGPEEHLARGRSTTMVEEDRDLRGTLDADARLGLRPRRRGQRDHDAVGLEPARRGETLGEARPVRRARARCTQAGRRAEEREEGAGRKEEGGAGGHFPASLRPPREIAS